MSLRNLLKKQRNFLVSSLLIILLSGSVSALELALYDTGYYKGETFQAFIDSKDVTKDLEAKDFVLYKYEGTNLSKVRFTPFYYKMNGFYFVHFALEGDGNFSFGVENIPTYVNDTEIIKSIRKDFNVVTSNKILSIRPAFFESTDILELNVINNNEDVNVVFNVPGFVRHPYEEELVANGRTRLFRFNVNISAVKESYNITMKYGDEFYDIPVFVKIEKEYKGVLKFLTDINVLDKVIDKDEELSGALRFQNMLDEPLYNLNFILTGNLNKIVRMNITKVARLNPGETGEQYFWVNEKGNASGEYKGDLILSSNKGKASMKMRFTAGLEVKEEQIIGEVQPAPGEKPIFERKEEVKGEQGPNGEQLFPFQQQVNFTSQPEILMRTSKGFIMFLIFILAIGILIWLLSRKGKERKTFEEYVKEYEKK